jgi:hypothetical protein
VLKLFHFVPIYNFRISDTICPGHNENDLLEFGDFLGNGETYTNKQFYDFMDPWNDDLPYTYDTFDYDYCTDTGYDFLGETTAETILEQDKGEPPVPPEVAPLPAKIINAEKQ